MNETERKQIKGALLKCAEENENRPISTGYVVVSSVCKSAVERIEELEKHNAELKAQLEKMKCCQNCKHSEEDNKSSTICDECFELCYWEMKE